MKKGVAKNNKVAFASLILFSVIILTLSFVLAAHVITTSTGGTSYSVDEDVGFIYNITINNTDTLEPANITHVNITLPSTFSFLVNSNGTDAGTHVFTNTSTILSWDNEGLVMNLTWKYFWFNATASTPGFYNLTISTTNATGTETTNISVTINDTTDPSSIEFVSPTESNNANRSQSNIAINITATDNGVINTIIARLFNSTRSEINSSNSSASPLFINFTGLSDGVYYFNATVNDTYGNSNSTSTRTITLDTTVPVITLIAPANATSSTTSDYNFTFNVTDTNSILNCSLILDGSIINNLTNVNNTGGTNGMYNSSLSAITHNWSVNCTDLAGNVGNSSTRTLTVSSVSTSTTSSSSGGSIISEWAKQKVHSWVKMTPGVATIIKDFDKDIGIKQIQIEVKNEAQNVKITVRKYNSKPANVSVEKSGKVHKYLQIETQNLEENLEKATITIQVNKSWVSENNLDKNNITLFKFNENTKKWNEISTNYIEADDKYYYYDIELTSFSFFAIGEKNTEQQITGEEATASSEDETEKTNLTWLWIVIAVIIILVLFGVGYKKLKKQKRK